MMVINVSNELVGWTCPFHWRSGYLVLLSPACRTSLSSLTVGLMVSIYTDWDCEGQEGMDIAMYVKLYFFNI